MTTKTPAENTSTARPRKTKPVAKTLAEPATKPGTADSAKGAKAQTKPRAKLVRDSFTMPQQDFDLIDLLKARALDLQRPAKKSELLRAGLQALAALPPARLKARLDQLVQLKTGRPKKGG